MIIQQFDEMNQQDLVESEDVIVPAGYKRTEVGIIPKDWKLSSILDLVEIRSGQVDPRYEPYKSMILIAPDHIESNTGRLLATKSAADQLAISGKYLFKRGDILYSKIRPYLKKATLAQIDGLCSADMYALRPKDNISSGFILAVTLSNHFTKYAESVSLRSGMPKINREELSGYTMAFPCFDEQIAIATALSDVDVLINELEKLLTKKQAIKTATIQQLLTGRTRLPQFSLHEDGSKKGYKQSELGEIPEDWKVRSLLNIANLIHGKAHEPYVSESGRFVVVNSKFISTEGLVRKYCSQNDCVAKQGDVLMVLSDLPNGRALAKCYYVEQDHIYAVNQRVCIFRTDTFDSKFLYFYLNRHKYFLALDDGVTQTHILNGDIKDCQLYVPSNIEEQTAIAIILSDMDDELRVLEQRLNKTRQIKQGMMQELLTGKTRLIQPKKDECKHA